MLVWDKVTGAHAMQTKRSAHIGGQKTSLSLEDAFWTSVKEIAKSRKVTMAALLTEIDAAREGNLSSAVMLYVLAYYRHHIREQPAAICQVSTTGLAPDLRPD